MSDAPIGTYTFLPWLRRGIANRIGGAPAGARATIDIALNIEGTNKSGGGQTVLPVNRPVALYGPGDIVGVEADAVQRTEPRHWVTNFEPNYLAAIEFYDEDLPWRYTPAPPSGRRLLPWLALVVLEEATEFKEGGNIAGKPLPFIDVTTAIADVMPPADELWAWAHVHFNEALSATDVVATDAAAVSAAAESALAANPDNAYSRILCPRKLAPNTAYHAFLIPAFESGRLAGLGVDPKPLFDDPANALTAQSSAWGTYGNRPATASFPYYYRWFFRTGTRGDFEYLVRLLKPKVVDSRVGHRDMDVQDPAPNVSGIDNPDLNGVLRMAGALKAPFATLKTKEKAEFTKFDQWATPYPTEFQEELAAFVNLADSYQDAGATSANGDVLLDTAINDDPDPLITPPIYGRWHALTDRLLTERDGTERTDRTNWVHDLNLDPRWRSAAGLGTEVIQDGQEEYMAAAWEQIGDVLEANRRIRQAQVAKEAGRYWHKRQIATVSAVSRDNVLMLYAPMQARVVSEGLTVRQRVKLSPLATATTSTTMRRLLRPGGRLAKRLGFAASRNAGSLVTRVNAGEISAAPPKVTPPGLPTPDAIANEIQPAGGLDGVLAGIGAWLRTHSLVAILILIAIFALFLFLVLFAGPAVSVLFAVVVAALLALVPRALQAAGQKADADSVKEEGQTPESVDALPGSSGFTLSTPIDVFTPTAATPLPPGQTDGAEAVRFKNGLRDVYRLVQESEKLGRVQPPVRLDIARVTGDLIVATDPALTVPRWIFNGIVIPPRIREQIGEDFVEAMAYPEIDDAMYKPLVDAGDDLFVPNLNLVEPDSVTLLETNQRFIEAYMVGLNHEFARELLWREYPTDQRGSYFRQFWDVRTQLVSAADQAAAREKLKDIPPIHKWLRSSDLGDHDNREAGRVNEEELVLVIRGELLKKYPNTIVTAQKAKWQPKSASDPTPDKAKERRFDDTSKPMTPLYEARVAPDIYFFGFDLVAKDARGDDRVDDKPGWFFRIEEVPGDARFGFDIERDGALNVWNDLSWPDVVPALADGKTIKVSAVPAQVLIEPNTPDVQEKHDQWDSDRHVPLNAAVSSAELAYIALQTPVIMAVHASELLPEEEAGDV
jgi:hypothetical protein